MNKCICCEAIKSGYTRIVIESGYGSYIPKYIGNNINYCPSCGKALNIIETEEVIEIRNIPMPQIKEEMLDLLSDKKTRYADEIAAELKLDIKDVIEAFRQLQEEDKLFIDETKLPVKE